MLHVHDHRSRREPVDPTVEQSAVTTVVPEPLPPIVVHDADLWDTKPIPNVAPTIDFPVDDLPPSRRNFGAGAALSFIVAIILLIVAFLLITRRLDVPISSDATLPPVSASQATSQPTVTIAPSTTAALPPPTVASTTAVVTTVAPVTTAVATTALATTVVETTVVPSTPPPTSVPATSPPTTVPPSAPAPAIAGPGTPQVLSDPLPSGTSAGDAGRSLALAQRLADALASGDWDVVRSIEPAKARLSDEQLAAGYAGLDRASLILVDARRQRDGYRQLLVSVANERNGAQTSLYCLQWSANTKKGSVVEQGSIGKLTTVRGTVSSGTVVNDPAMVDLISSRCVWR